MVPGFIKDILSQPQKDTKLAAVMFIVRWIGIGYVLSLTVASIGTLELMFDDKVLIGDYVYFPLFLCGTLGWVLLVIKPKSEYVRYAMVPIVLTCIIRLLEAITYEDTGASTFGRFNGTTIVGIWMTLIWSLVAVVILTEYHVQVKGSRLSG
jgi:hypothetical protein